MGVRVFPPGGGGSGGGDSLVRNPVAEGYISSDQISDTHAGWQEFADSLEDYETVYVPPIAFKVSDTVVFDQSRYNNFDSLGWFEPFGAFDGFLLRIQRPADSNPVGDLSDSSRIFGKIRLRCNGQSRGIQLWNQDCSDFWIDVERPYGTAVQLRTCRESVFWGMRIYNGATREALDPGAVTEWDSGESYVEDDVVSYPYAAYNSGTGYSINNVVTGSNGRLYRSIQDSNTNHDPTTDSNSEWWAYVPTEYYKALEANTNKDPLTNNANAAVEADRIWQKVFMYEAGLDMNEDIIGGTFADSNNALAFYSLDIRNCDYPTLVRIDVNNGTSAVRSINFYQPHLHYIGQNYIDNVAIPYGYEQQIYDYACGVELGRCTNIEFWSPEMNGAEVSHAYQPFLLGAINTLKNCNLVNIHGGIVDGSAPRMIGVHVMPSMQTSIRNMVNTRYSLDDADSIEVVDPLEKLFYKIDAKTYVDQLILENLSDSTQFARIRCGNGTPEGNVLGNPGDVYIRRNSLTALTVYIKEAGNNTNTNWFPAATLRGGTTAARPSGVNTTGHRGVMYYDTTLGKPIWWSGAAWVDATGATV